MSSQTALSDFDTSDETPERTDPTGQWSIEHPDDGCHGCGTPIGILPWAWIDPGRDDDLHLFASICEDCSAIYPTGGRADKLVETHEHGQIGFSTPETVEQFRSHKYTFPNPVRSVELELTIKPGCQALNCDSGEAAIVVGKQATGHSPIEITVCERHRERYLDVGFQLVQEVDQA